MINHMRKVKWRRVSTGVVTDSQGENGSAVVEFVLIATPLFIPAILFFNAMHASSTEEMNVSNIARQAVRAFATAPDLYIGHQRVKYILDQFSEIETQRDFGSGKRYDFTYNISCGAEKCLTPGSLVELELFRKVIAVQGLDSSKERKSRAVARTYVDKWRATE